MRRRGSGRSAAAAVLLAALAAAPAASAVEYRLLVASTFEVSFSNFLAPGDLVQGKASAGLARLESSFDAGRVPSGAILYDRRVEPVRESVARAYGGARVVPRVKRGGDGGPVWDEVSWEGSPGERSVWLVSPILRSVQELYNAALRGKGSLRYYQPFASSLNGSRWPALLVPLNYLWFYEERGTVWSHYLSKSLDLEDGVGFVGGVNANQQFPDQVYLVVRHLPEPTTYKAVLVWRSRALDREAPRAPFQQ